MFFSCYYKQKRNIRKRTIRKRKETKDGVRSKRGSKKEKKWWKALE